MNFCRGTIDSVAVRELSALGETEFCIVSSHVKGQVSTGIPADAATCVDCLRSSIVTAAIATHYL